MAEANNFADTAGLIQRVEVLRMALREAANTFWPRADISVLQCNFESVRAELMTLSSSNLVPRWLADAPTLEAAVGALPWVHGLPPVEQMRRRRACIETDLAPLLTALEKEKAVSDSARLQIRSSRIQLRVDRFFKKQMRVEQRALHALSLGCPEGESAMRALWRNTLLTYPALAAIIETALPPDVPYASFVADLFASNPIHETKDVSDTFIWRVLGDCFARKRIRTGSQAVLTEHGKAIAGDGLLLAADLLQGQLEPPLGSKYEIPPLAFALRSRTPQLSDTIGLFDFTTSFISRLKKSFGVLRERDISCGDQQFAIIDDGHGIKIRPFGTWSYCSSPTGHEDDADGYRSDVVQPATLFSEEALATLESLIEANALEADFQRFFERFPEFLHTLGPYSRVHSQLVLTDDIGQRLIPDFFLENCATGFADICDLKRPNAQLIKDCSGRLQFRDRLMAAVRQLSEYRDYFESSTNRKRFEEHYPGLRAFRPRVILVIGRREYFYDELERLRLESELRDGVIIRTYDEVISSARHWRSVVNKAGFR